MTDADSGRPAPRVGRALVVHPVLRDAHDDRRTPEARLAEAVGLAAAIDLDVFHAETVRLNRPNSATLLGSGIVEQLGALVAGQDDVVVIVDHVLTPIQQRNLERALKAKVIDRTGLILEIFGERARTREGQLQVELAALSYQRSRLVRSWTHLERQRGGFGFLGGPGESQLEMDRRLIGDRILKLKRELNEVRRTRALHRRARSRGAYPVIALVGYTNAGKSTLFNRLAGAHVFAEDLLFATLDPTMRAVALPSGRKAIVSDTVGFISDLPTHLVAAFRATLEEVSEADLILHVRDAAHPDREAQRDDVERVLGSLGIDPAGDGRTVEVFNKIDLLTPPARDALCAQVARARDLSGPAIEAVSALTAAGIDDLLAMLDARLGPDRQVARVAVPLEDGAAIAWLYARAEITGRHDDERFAHLELVLDRADLARFERRYTYRAEAPDTSSPRLGHAAG